MTKAQHTPELYKAPFLHVLDKHNRPVLGTGEWMAQGEREALARRATAALNALAGIPTSCLEGDVIRLLVDAAKLRKVAGPESEAQSLALLEQALEALEAANGN